MDPKLKAISEDIARRSRARATMTEQEAIGWLRTIQGCGAFGYNGRKAGGMKAAIRRAWCSGDYRGNRLAPWECQLQNIRNQFGPSWLARVRV